MQRDRRAIAISVPRNRIRTPDSQRAQHTSARRRQSLDRARCNRGLSSVAGWTHDQPRFTTHQPLPKLVEPPWHRLARRLGTEASTTREKGRETKANNGELNIATNQALSIYESRVRSNSHTLPVNDHLKYTSQQNAGQISTHITGSGRQPFDRPRSRLPRAEARADPPAAGTVCGP